jgi:predicted nuclease with TOPRIM domain
MAEEPEHLVLHHLRDIRAGVTSLRTEVKEMRGDVHEIRTVLDSHTLRFDFLEERVEMLREGTLTAIGFAASANEQNRKLAQQVADLAKRVEKLEAAQ